MEIEAGDDPTVLSLIAFAVEAGANRRAARVIPRAARSLHGIAEMNSRQVTLLAAQIVEEAARQTPGKAASPMNSPGDADGEHN